MPTFDVYPDEWWPVCTLVAIGEHTRLDCVLEFSDEEITDLRRVSREFAAWQRRIYERLPAKGTRPYVNPPDSLFSGLLPDGEDMGS